MPETAIASNVATNLGRAELVASSRSGRTVVSHQYSCAPLQWLGPLHPSDRRQVLYLRNPNGGLLRGDAQSISIRLEANAHVEIRTQSATRLHPGLSRQDIEIILDADSSLVWVNHPAILGTDTEFEQAVNVTLAPTARLAYAEVWAAGRLAMSQEFAPTGADELEQWQFKRLSNRLRVDRDGSPVLRDAIVSMFPHSALTTAGVLQSYTCWGSLYLFGNWPNVDWPETDNQWAVKSQSGDRILRMVSDRSIDIWQKFQYSVSGF
ncbi:MAG: urease accessory protein UreD [Cyanobacteria bacterium P01_E01_bin.34]